MGKKKSKPRPISPRPHHSPPRNLTQVSSEFESNNSFTEDHYLTSTSDIEEKLLSKGHSNCDNLRSSSNKPCSFENPNVENTQNQGSAGVKTRRESKDKKEIEMKRRKGKKDSKHRTSARSLKRLIQEDSHDWGKDVSSEYESDCTSDGGKNASIVSDQTSGFSMNSIGTSTRSFSSYSVMSVIQQVSELRPSTKKKLILSDSCLTTENIPLDEICSMPLGSELYTLSLARNQLFHVPKKIVQDLSGLRTLDLSNCELRTLPDGWDLPNLVSLYLRENKLTNFPQERVLLGLPSLKLLDLYGNSIDMILLPDHQDVLANLETLDIGYNEVIDLPENINVLRNLKHLKIKNNILKKIPQSICDLDLKTIEVSGNPLFEPPQETCDRGIDSIRRYFRAIREEEMGPAQLSFESEEVSSVSPEKKSVRYWSSESGIIDENEIAVVNDTLKVNFVGISEAGKTSIIIRLCHGKDKALPLLEDRTIGVEINSWDPEQGEAIEEGNSSQIDTRIDIDGMNSLKLEENDVNVKFSLWDFAGQDVYHSTHELFFSQLALYIIVWDMSANNRKTFAKKEKDTSEFTLDFSDDEDDEDSFDYVQNEARAALHEDIDKNVQFWVDCIQSSVPGAVILPIGSFNDKFEDANEAKKRCATMKDRLLEHEKERVHDIARHLRKYSSDGRENSEEAERLRSLRDNRPKLILSDSDGDMVRISSTECTGFRELKEKIVQIATGRELGGCKTPLFSGHIGARIPRMRLEVKDLVKQMRSNEHFFVDLDHFYAELGNKGIDNKEDIHDTLHFLSNVGELVYFGEFCNKMNCNQSGLGNEVLQWNMSGDFVEESDSEEESRANDCKSKAKKREDKKTCHHSLLDDRSNDVLTLSQYIFFNPRLLVVAISCILRHDLGSILGKLYRDLKKETSQRFDNNEYPIITSEDVRLLWKREKIIQKTIDKMEKSFRRTSVVSPYDFLQRLLTHFRVFVPINLQGRTTRFNNMEHNHNPDSSPSFFLPSLLNDKTPDCNFFKYKGQSHRLTLCHSWLFSECFPPGIMERIMASVLNYIYVSSDDETCSLVQPEQQLFWRTAFYLKLGDVEVFLHLSDKTASRCVASEHMEPGAKRLSVSGQGNSEIFGEKIWNGGYGLVIKAVRHVMKGYPGLEYEEQSICPICLESNQITEASHWDWIKVRSSVQNEEMTCKYAHRVKTPRLSGHLTSKCRHQEKKNDDTGFENNQHTVKVQDLFRSYVLVAVYDPNLKRVVVAGSGFIADEEKGLIVTAAHTVMVIHKRSNFGKDCLGLKNGQIIIGVLPDEPGQAVFRYFADIVEKDPLIDSERKCVVDACVLKIKTRLKCDVKHEMLKNIMDIPQRVIRKIQDENLKQLKICKAECEIEEHVRIVGFNQGRDRLHRNLSITYGSVASIFVSDKTISDVPQFRHEALKEVVSQGDTFEGESGGPSINLRGEVVGILSRGLDDRCFLVPGADCYELVKKYKERSKRRLTNAERFPRR